MVNKFLHLTQQAFLPHSCILCGMGCPSEHQGMDLCSHCQYELPRLQHSCTICALPLPTHSHSPQCGHCMISPPPFSKTVAGWYYQAPVDQLISSFKYSRKINHALVLATLFSPIVQQAYSHSPYPDIIIPTPLHWLRRWRRGFNQSELLANWLAKSLSLPMARYLKRSRATPAQQSLSAQQRKLNLKNAFSLNSAAQARIAGKTIAVVDDVMTTGATATTISQTLLKSGAKEVHIWCLARTDHKH